MATNSKCSTSTTSLEIKSGDDIEKMCEQLFERVKSAYSQDQKLPYDLLSVKNSTWHKGTLVLEVSGGYKTVEDVDSWDAICIPDSLDVCIRTCGERVCNKNCVSKQQRNISGGWVIWHTLYLFSKYEVLHLSCLSLFSWEQDTDTDSLLKWIREISLTTVANMDSSQSQLQARSRYEFSNGNGTMQRDEPVR